MSTIFAHRPVRRVAPRPPSRDIEPELAARRQLEKDIREMINTDRQTRAVNRAERRAWLRTARNAARHFQRQPRGDAPHAILESYGVAPGGLCFFDFFLPEGF